MNYKKILALLSFVPLLWLAVLCFQNFWDFSWPYSMNIEIEGGFAKLYSVFIYEELSGVLTWLGISYYFYRYWYRKSNREQLIHIRGIIKQIIIGLAVTVAMVVIGYFIEIPEYKAFVSLFFPFVLVGLLPALGSMLLLQRIVQSEK